MHLIRWPLIVITPPQSGGLDGGEQPSGLPGASLTLVALPGLLRSFSVELLLRLDIGAHLRFLTPNRGHGIPAPPAACPMDVAGASTNLARHSDGARALARANPLGHRLLRRPPAAPGDLGRHPRPCYDGAPPRPGQRTPPGPKPWLTLALQGLLASLGEKDPVICPIPLCVA